MTPSIATPRRRNGIAAVADVAILEDRRSAQVLDRDHLAEQLGPQGGGSTALEQRYCGVGKLGSAGCNGPPQGLSERHRQDEMG